MALNVSYTCLLHDIVSVPEKGFVTATVFGLVNGDGVAEAERWDVGLLGPDELHFACCNRERDLIAGDLKRLAVGGDARHVHEPWQVEHELRWAITEMILQAETCLICRDETQ